MVTCGEKGPPIRGSCVRGHRFRHRRVKLGPGKRPGCRLACTARPAGFLILARGNKCPTEIRSCSKLNIPRGVATSRIVAERASKRALCRPVCRLPLGNQVSHVHGNLNNHYRASTFARWWGLGIFPLEQVAGPAGRPVELRQGNKLEVNPKHNSQKENRKCQGKTQQFSVSTRTMRA